MQNCHVILTASITGGPVAQLVEHRTFNAMVARSTRAGLTNTLSFHRSIGMYQQTRRYIEERLHVHPRIAVVLGSGLGDFAAELTETVEMPYADIPGWPRSTAVGHAGKFIAGKLDGTPLIVLAGRAHLYEGYSPGRVVYAMRILHLLGVKQMVLTNAAGGINLTYSQGALVLVSDHINLQGVNPLSGANEYDFGPRFPDMSEAYSKEYREIALHVAA